MAFLAVAVIAICEEKEAAAIAALEDLKAAGKELVGASIVLGAAMLTRIKALIKPALVEYDAKFKAFQDAKKAMEEANESYRLCAESHGAGSGSNSSGSNNG